MARGATGPGHTDDVVEGPRERRLVTCAIVRLLIEPRVLARARTPALYAIVVVAAYETWPRVVA